MEAGRELDKLIAERVMGWKFFPTLNSPYCSNCGRERYICDYACLYSSDMGAAWEVIEKVAFRTGVWLLVYRCDEDEDERIWVAYERTGRADWTYGLHAYGHTAPEAICNAALEAVGALCGMCDNVAKQGSTRCEEHLGLYGEASNEDPV